MCAVLAPPIAVGLAHAQSSGSAPTSPSASAIASSIQSAYKGTTTFSADFTQRYKMKAFGTEKKSNGTVVFVQPDKMRWAYATGDVTASDGATIRMYDATTKTVKSIVASTSHLPAAFAFLAGKGTLATTHDLSLPPKCPMKGGWCLVAKPKTPTNAYDAVFFYVDAATGQVRRVIVIDAQGNTNAFDFDKQVLNGPAPPASAFTKVP
jgi:outer membrane lipoprotein carrier protein